VRTSDQPAGELSYWLLPEARGGLAFTAVTEMMKIAGDAGLKSLVLDIEEENRCLDTCRGASCCRAENSHATTYGPFGDEWVMVVYVLPVR